MRQNKKIPPLSQQLIRRRRQNKKKNKGVPLTEDMLNELNKNHISVVENNAANDSFYDIGDAWDHPNFPTKPIQACHSFVYMLAYSIGKL